MASTNDRAGCLPLALGPLVVGVVLLAVYGAPRGTAWLVLGVLMVGLGVLGLVMMWAGTHNAWKGYTPPPGWRLAAEDPAVQALWAADTPPENLDHVRFENVLDGMMDGRRLVCFETVDGDGLRRWWLATPLRLRVPRHKVDWSNDAHTIAHGIVPEQVWGFLAGRQLRSGWWCTGSTLFARYNTLGLKDMTAFLDQDAHTFVALAGVVENAASANPPAIGDPYARAPRTAQHEVDPYRPGPSPAWPRDDDQGDWGTDEPSQLNPWQRPG